MAEDRSTATPVQEEALLTRYRAELRALAGQFCRERGYVLQNADQTIADFAQMRLQYGKFFCPCQPANQDDTICVCEPVRNGLVDFEGACFCNFFTLPPGRKAIKDELAEEPF